MLANAENVVPDRTGCARGRESGNVLGHSFVPWQKSSIQAIKSIQALWPGEAPRETIRDIAWLANTQFGDEIAREYATDGKYPEGT